jgi:uncharacterized protein YjbI with pentapeptide repeats
MKALLGILIVTIACIAGASDTGAKWLQRAQKGETFLIGADFRGANLADLDLNGAKLLAADLTDANLLGVDLSNADLRGAKGLTAEQLNQARSLKGARLDPKLESRLQKMCPQKLNSN